MTVAMEGQMEHEQSRLLPISEQDCDVDLPEFMAAVRRLRPEVRKALLQLIADLGAYSEPAAAQFATN